MSFKINYDKDGQASGNTKPIQEIEALPTLPLERFEQPGLATDHFPAQVVENMDTTESTVETMETDNDVRSTSEHATNSTPEDNSGRETEQSREGSYQAKNFKTLREDKIRSDRERDEALAKLRAYEMQQYQIQQQSRQPVVTESEDIDIEIGAEDIAEGKHINALVNEVKKLRGMVKQTEQRSTVMTKESNLLAKYPDFYNVVSSESIARLQQEDPELAQVLDTSSDLYGAKAMAYKAIKKMTAVKTEPTYEAEKAQIQKNAAKPKPLASLSPQQGDSPLSRANAFANGLTPALQEQLRREMADARRNN